jgi:hypothetical protein
MHYVPDTVSITVECVTLFFTTVGQSTGLFEHTDCEPLCSA